MEPARLFLPALDVVDRDHRGDHRVEDPLRRLVAVPVEHRRVGHQVPDVADQHQADARQGHAGAVRRGVLAGRVHGAVDHAAALLETVGQVALDQAEPVPVGDHLVLGVDARHRVLEIHDGRRRRFQQDVLDAGGVVPADGVAAIDGDLDVEAVVAEQDRRRRGRVAAIAGELGGVGQPRRGAVLERGAQRAAGHRVGGDVGVAAAGQRHDAVEELPRTGDDAGAADRVVLGRAFAAAVLGDGVGPVERVVEAAPAGVGGVQRVARIRHRHDELRPCDGRDLGIDVGGLGREALAFGHQVADLPEHRLVLRQVDRLVVVLAVPGVDAALQLFPLGEQLAVAGREVVDQPVEPGPEPLRGDARTRQRLVVDEVVELPVDLQSARRDPLRHACLLLTGPAGISRRARRGDSTPGAGGRLRPARCNDRATTSRGAGFRNPPSPPRAGEMHSRGPGRSPGGP